MFRLSVLIILSCVYNYGRSPVDAELRESHNGEPVVQEVSINPLDHKKPLTLIFTSEGGGGHRSADKAIQSYIEEFFEVELAFPIRDVFMSLDPVRWCTFNRYGGEDFYNFCLGHRWYRLTNMIGSFGSMSVWLHRSRLESILENFIKQKNPNFIISVIPFYNGPLLTVAQKLNIPCLIIPTDLNSQFFAHDIKDITYNRWGYVLPFIDPDMLNYIQPIIPLERLIFGGFPIRKSFFTPKDKQILRKKIKIPENKAVVMLLMGAEGSEGSFDCMKSIIELNTPIHVIVCLGRRRDQLRHRFKKLKIPKNITYTLVGFTDHIADLMAASDILVTKSGTVSFCEGIYSGIPMILDGTTIVPTWEQFNHVFGKKYDCVDILTKYSDLKDILARYLNETGYMESKKRAIAALSRNNLEEILVPLMHDMLTRAPRQEEKKEH